MQGFFRIPARLHLGLILMTELAATYADKQPVSLRVVAERMQVSDGYLEEISALLRSAKLIRGQTGPKGGYRLAKAPSYITVEDIVCAIEGPIHLVECHDGCVCPVEHLCQSKKLWDFLQKDVQNALRKKKLSEFVSQ